MAKPEEPLSAKVGENGEHIENIIYCGNTSKPSLMFVKKNCFNYIALSFEQSFQLSQILLLHHVFNAACQNVHNEKLFKFYLNGIVVWEGFGM